MTPLELHLQHALLRVVFNGCDCGFLHSSGLQVLGDAWRAISENIVPQGSSGSIIQDLDPNSNGNNSEMEGDNEHHHEENKENDNNNNNNNEHEIEHEH